MAEIPVVRTPRAAFDWPVPPTAAQRAATGQLAAGESAGTRFSLPPAARTSLGVKTQTRKSTAAWISTHVNLLRFTDAAVVMGAAYVGFLLSDAGFLPEGPKDGGAAIAGAALTITWLASLELYHTRDLKVLGIGADEYRRVASATLRIFGLMALAAVVFSIHGASAFVTVSLPLGLVALTVNRHTFRRRLTTEKAKGRHLSRAVVVGEPEDVRYVVQQVRKSGAVYEILGACLPGARRGAGLRVDGSTVAVLSSTDAIARTVRLVEA